MSPASGTPLPSIVRDLNELVEPGARFSDRLRRPAVALFEHRCTRALPRIITAR
jgi:hypothetical protein